MIIASISWNQINVLVSSEESDFEANFLRVNPFPPHSIFSVWGPDEKIYVNYYYHERRFSRKYSLNFIKYCAFMVIRNAAIVKAV